MVKPAYKIWAGCKNQVCQVMFMKERFSQYRRHVAEKQCLYIKEGWAADPK